MTIGSSVARNFGKSAQSYRQGAQLQLDSGKVLLQSLDTSLLEPKPNQQESLCALDLGCGPGLFTEALQQRSHQVYSLDLAKPMLDSLGESTTKIQANAHFLPFSDNSFDILFSNLMVQWCDLPKVLAEVYRVLKPSGIACISTLVDGTLFELKTAWAEVDDDQHLHQYLNESQVLQAVKSNDWCSSSVRLEEHVYWFQTAKDLAKELKFLGANLVTNRKQKGLVTKSKWQKMEQAYSKQFYSVPNQAMPATYKMQYMTLVK